MARVTDFEYGARVAWRRGAQTSTGAVLRKAVCLLDVAGAEFRASRKTPCFLVRCDADGALTAVSRNNLRRLA